MPLTRAWSSSPGCGCEAAVRRRGGPWRGVSPPWPRRAAPEPVRPARDARGSLAAHARAPRPPCRRARATSAGTSRRWPAACPGPRSRRRAGRRGAGPSWPTCAPGATTRCASSPPASTACAVDDLRVPADERRRRARPASRPRCGRRWRWPRPHRGLPPRIQVRRSGDPPSRRSGVRGAVAAPCPSTGPGCYVPGGRASYPSTVLMTAVPARVAGVGEVVLCVAARPPTARVPDATLAAAAHGRRRRGVPHRRRPGHRRHGLRHRDDRARSTSSSGPGNVYVAIAKREVAPGGLVGVPVGVRRAQRGRGRGRRVGRRPTYAAIDVILQAEHGPDGLAWLVTWDEAVADAVTSEVVRLVEASAPPGRHRGDLRGGRLRRARRLGRRRRWRSPTPSPPSTSSCWSPTPRRCCRWCATPARCSAGHGRRPASATTWPARPTCCPRSARPASARRSPWPTSPSTSTCHRSTRAALDGLGAARGRAGRRRGAARPRRLRAPAAGEPVNAPPPAGRGPRCGTICAPSRATTRRRSTWTSGSTPTSRPEPPPAAWRDALAAELAAIDWHRYPDRAATDLRAAIAAAHGVGARAGLRRQRLQRGAADAAADLRRARAARWPRSSRRTSCTATSPGSPAPRVVEGERRADFTLDPAEVRRVLAAAGPP